jgi:uncharacterized protein (TIGR03084 family)
VVDNPVSALAQQQDALSGILTDLDGDGWHRPTRCEGWDVADVVLHLSQTNEMAIGSVKGDYDAVLSRLTGGLQPAASVDEGAAMMVDRDRGGDNAAVLARWTSSAREFVTLLAAEDMSKRVQWVAGYLSLRTLVTTRLAETWIHTGDVAAALGLTLPAFDGLRLIARLAWRTLPYAFASVGLTLSGPVAFRLTAPDGSAWDYIPEDPAVTTIFGPAADLCQVAARRVKAGATGLQGEGPDVDAILELVRTYA